jgi:membrane-associated phospholipid phosphatase
VVQVFLGPFVFLVSLFAVAFRSGLLKKFPLAVIAIVALLLPVLAAAQTANPDQSSPVVPSAAAPSPAVPAPAAPSPNEPAETAAAPAQSPEAPYDRPVSWKLLFRNVISDQKHIWTFPVRLAQGQNLIPTAAVAGVTAGLFYADPKESAYFRNTTTFNGFRNVFNGNATAIGMGAVPASLYVIGRFRKDSKMAHTGLLAGEALADIVLVQTALKDVARRVKPARYPTSGWFESKGPPASYLRGNGSFPSGHSMAAFAVATVVARRYGGTHRWVPYVAYGLASAVGFSRLTLNVHFLSDIAMGGAIGYSISRFTVLRQ